MHRVVVLDFETYPINGKSLIMEIGCVEVIDGVIGDTFSTLVRPETRVSDFVLNLTGINHDHLDEAPLFSDISVQFNQFIKNSMVVAHNAFLDRMSYESTCNFYDLVPDNFVWVDSQDIFRWVYPTIRTLQLQQLFKEFNVTQEQSHRALDDAIGLAELLQIFARTYPVFLTSFEVLLLKHSSLKSIQNLIRFILLFLLGHLWMHHQLILIDMAIIILHPNPLAINRLPVYWAIMINL